MFAQDYDPELEQRLIALGKRPTVARKMTRFFGLLKEKPPETDEERED